MNRFNKRLRQAIQRFRNKIRGQRVMFKDINSDGRPDCIFLVKGEYLRTYFGEMEYAYKLVYKSGLDKGFGDPVTIRRFRGKPESLIIEDIDGDSNLDIVYFQKGEFLFMRYGDAVFIYRLMFMDGRGDGTFRPPQQIATFRGLPEKI